MYLEFSDKVGYKVNKMSTYLLIFIDFNSTVFFGNLRQLDSNVTLCFPLNTITQFQNYICKLHKQ